ncbi:MAG: WYL domain-containing protein, partial [Candidatus Omnitrophica bacterium]|nr:WYL domain-containing protein [Candidatus Omnitrophota bacterium]
YFKDRIYFPKQKVVEEKKDGSIIIETLPAHPDEIIHTVTHWLPHIRVVSPEKLKLHVKGMVEEYLKGF